MGLAYILGTSYATDAVIELRMPAGLLVAVSILAAPSRANLDPEREFLKFAAEHVDTGILEYEVEVAKFNIPLSDTRALASDGKSFWTVESFNGSRQVFQLGLNFEPLKSYKTPGDAISGIAFDGKSYWSSDVKSDQIYKHDRDWRVLKTIRAPGDWIYGLAFDGNHIYSNDHMRKEVYRHDANGDAVEMFALGHVGLMGIAFHDGFFWGTSGTSGMVFKFDRKWKLVGFFRAAHGGHAGIAFDGDRLMCVDFHDSRIYRYQITGSHPFTSSQKPPPKMTPPGQSYESLVRQLFPDEKLKGKPVAVASLYARYPFLKSNAAVAQERLTNAIAKTGKCALIERSRLDKVAEEIHLGMSGALSRDSAVELGKLAGARYLVVGSLEKDDSGTLLIARLVDVSTGKVLSSGEASFKSASGGGL